MKKTVWRKICCICAVLTLIIAVFLLSSQEVHALKALVLLEVTGTFESLDETVTPNVIALKVRGQDASGPLWNSCTFFDEKEAAITQGDFVERYLTHDVTLEIIEDTGEIYSGRPAKR
jgi:hypothetical protein